ncbi:general secretion pathway protein J [Candidatus Photodesmus blepharus]|uniref:Type II secretion system protein J n=1 Tax=Candidatus Photodesmus blepharonis TaxID=1179155 RepID=A0A084CNK2_9GAMM|nr:type II secretion system minor pseudopilin GspJ [Candidatus Photodesmus blepharus]KEY91381.1 general secretion pathway protein J [Candidatus Photodesmus blepharus]
MNKYSKGERNRGFTLVETLVSIAVLASLSIAVYQIVDQVQKSNELSLERGNRLKELQRALIFMDSDFRQMAARVFRTNGDKSSSQFLLNYENESVLFTRLGWHNPQQRFPRGEVAKVGYYLKDKVLQRVWWQYPDTLEGDIGTIAPILTGIESFNMKFYDGNIWYEQWQTLKILPQAVSVILELEDYGEIERVYLIASNQTVNSK